VKDDTAVTDDLRRCNLILFGDPVSNRWIGRVLPRLPIRWRRDELQVGKGKCAAADHAPALIQPNPLPGAGGRYVVLNSGHIFREKQLASLNYLLFPRLGDWAVLRVGGKVPDEPPGPLDETVLRAGFFDERWLLPTADGDEWSAAPWRGAPPAGRLASCPPPSFPPRGSHIAHPRPPAGPRRRFPPLRLRPGPGGTAAPGPLGAERPLVGGRHLGGGQGPHRRGPRAGPRRARHIRPTRKGAGLEVEYRTAPAAACRTLIASFPSANSSTTSTTRRQRQSVIARQTCRQQATANNVLFRPASRSGG
jgi:hypothetical protein